jgi:antibiotic biosynthesis monooxygenase (ABM) superfamily enzyme
MLEEPLAIGEEAENHQVTAIISHLVRLGREQDYEEWFYGIATAVGKFKGHLGVNMIRPRDQAHPEYSLAEITKQLKRPLVHLDTST